MPKITKFTGKNVIQVKTRDATSADPKVQNSMWWKSNSTAELAESLFGVVNFIRDNQGYRMDQMALFARMYANMPLFNYLGGNFNKLNNKNQFPQDRPTFNVVASCVDTLVSRMIQNKPKPMFLTDGGNYKNRKLAKELNKFIEGEFYRLKVYEKREANLRNACVLGDGVFKVYETEDKKVGLEHVLCTELYVDEADGMYGEPQNLYQLKLVNRDILAAAYPDHKGAIMTASDGVFDASSETDSITSQIMVVEAWHLKSGNESKDGRHVICIENAKLYDEDFEDDDFPFAKFPYAPRTLGYWSQGMSERLMGLQISINQLLYTQHMGLHLCGIPKWLIEDGSKIVSAHINNQIGGFIKYQGTPPALQSSQVFPPEIYQQLERYINMAFQQEGISQLSATSQKPAGLNSGTALREYDDLQTDRFAALSHRDQDFIVKDLAYKIFNQARKIKDKYGEYETVYTDKKGVGSVELPDMDDDDNFIIEAYPVSGYSKNPPERKQQIVEDMQAGLISPEEGFRLLDFPDLKQVSDLKNAPEERILKILDEIVEDGLYTPPDPFMPLPKARELAVQYYNKFTQEELEEEKAQLLLNFLAQIDALTAAAMPPPDPMMGGMAPQAVAEPQPISPMIPNVSGQAA